MALKRKTMRQKKGKASLVGQTHTFWVNDAHRLARERLLVSVQEPHPFRVEPLSNQLGNVILAMGLERVKKQNARTWCLVALRKHQLAIAPVLLLDCAWIHNSTERPVQRLVDWDENHLLLENVDALVLRPVRDGGCTTSLQSREEVRREEVD